MTQPAIDILGLNTGDPKASDYYPAVDVTDVTESTVGTTKKYLLADLIEFILGVGGFILLPPSAAATVAPYLNVVYDNGVGGINATITDNSGTFDPFVIDGIPGIVSSFTTPTAYVIKTQIDPIQNGIYVLVQNGDGISIPWRLMRANYFNSDSNIRDNAITVITGGNTLANTAWQVDVINPVTVGVSPIHFTQFQFFESFINLPLLPQYGGTGKANPSFATITLGGALSIVSAFFPTTINITGVTNVTMPVSGTLLSTLHYPDIGVAAGKIFISNGVDWSASNPIWPNAAALGDIIYGSATNVLSMLPGNITIQKQYLSQTGTGLVSAAPLWSTIDGGDIVGYPLTKVDDTNVTLTLSANAPTALLRATSLTLGWAGFLPVTRGGTGLGAVTLHNLLIGNGTSALTLLPPSATIGVPVVSQGAALDPVYGIATVPGGGTGDASFTPYTVICGGTTSTGNLQNVSGVGAIGQVLTSGGPGLLPTWQSTVIPPVTPGGFSRIMLLMGG